MTYGDVGGCKEQIEKLKEVVEMPLLHVSLCRTCSCPVALTVIIMYHLRIVRGNYYYLCSI